MSLTTHRSAPRPWEAAIATPPLVSVGTSTRVLSGGPRGHRERARRRDLGILVFVYLVRTHTLPIQSLGRSREALGADDTVPYILVVTVEHD